MDTETGQNTHGFTPNLATVLETGAFETQSPVDSSHNPDGFSIFCDVETKSTDFIAPISHDVADTTQTLSGLLGSEGLNPESYNVDSSEPLIMVMPVKKDTCFDAIETLGIDSVVSSPLKEHDGDNSSVKGNANGDGCEIEIDGKSVMQIDCKSSSSEDDETGTGDDGENGNHRFQYLDHHYYRDQYRGRRFSRFYNHHHPSFNDGLWGREDKFQFSPWHEHQSFREDGGCREYWRREPPGFSVPMLKVEPTGLGAGLSNLGNTCFMNAILQCFTHTVPLVKALRSCTHASASNGGCEEFCVLCALCEHVDLSLKSSGKVLSPSKFVDNLTHISSCFQRYQQEDAHEFLQCLLDRLERCLSSDSNGENTSQEDNMVQRVFGGRLVSKLKCCNCGQCSDKFEPLVDLSLEIEDANTLQNALESFTKVETIDDPEAKFKCENCELEVSREKQLMVDQAPLVATFHLKRFKSDGTSVEKIGKHVDFPLELDLKPYTNSSANCDMELKYQLYAIVVHNGFLPTSGHYFSYIRSSPETWHKLDDSMVVKVEEEFVLSQAAYILFYAKDGTPWFSNMREIEMLSVVDSSISNTSPKSVLENVDRESAYQNGASTAAHFDDCAATTTGDVEPMEISDIKDAEEVEPMLEVIQISDRAEGVSFNVSGESGPGGSNLECYKSRGGTPEGTAHVATNAVRDDGKKSLQSDLNCKENYSFQDNKGVGDGGSHPPTTSRFVSQGNSHGKPERRCRDNQKVVNRVNCKRSPGKGERREAIRRIQNMGNSSKRKKLLALLPRSEKKKRSRSSPRKDSPTHSRRKLLHQFNDEGQEGRVRICRESKQFDTMKRTCLFQGV